MSSMHWKIPEIKGTYIELAEDGELEQYPVSIPNVSYTENVTIFRKYYEYKKDERRYLDITSGQVYKRLLELQRAAEMMKKTFDKNMLTKATPESEVTLKQFSTEHTFRLPNGQKQLFSWHVRYTGGYAGRIFFYPVVDENVIYIGHIGHKLPTVKYH